MSWINNRSSAGSQSLPPANPTTAATAPQSGSVGFGGGAAHQPPQAWQQQQLNAYNHQTQQYSPQNNNLYTVPSNQGSRNIPQQSWQQQQQQPILKNQHQPPQQFQPMSNQYFNKQNPVVDGYVQQNLMAPAPISNQSTPQHFHQQSPNQNNFFTPNLNINASSSDVLNQPPPPFGKPELQPSVDNMTSTVQANDSQQRSEGWDDWEWNDNNQSLHSEQMSQQLPDPSQQITQNYTQQNLIADSFSIDQTDNWSWNTDDAKNSNLTQPLNENLQMQNHSVAYGQPPLGVVSNVSVEDTMKSVRPPSVGSVPSSFVQNVMQPPQFSAQQTQQTLQQPQAIGQQMSVPSQQIVTSVPVQQVQVSVQQSQPVVDGTGSPLSNNVYVSQAKPVSQPARQYAMTPSLAGQATPPNTVNNEIDSQVSSLEISSAPSFPPPPPVTQTPPLPPLSTAVGGNPYKRAGVAQHHRVALAPTATQQPSVMQPQFLGPVVGDFQHVPQPSGNQECLAPDNSEVIVDNKSYEFENQEIAPVNDHNQYQEPTPSNERNQYLQTDHLSEERYNNVELAQESNEQDNFPPPGLSRLVLGQPEADNSQPNSSDQSVIPPGLDRMIPGTELVTAGINMERQADGQDTIPAPRSVFSNVSSMPVDNLMGSMDISDRNLYLVPGESDVHEQRIVTGLENGASPTTTEHREVELDGENLEDQQQQQQQQQHHMHHDQHFVDDIEITRDEPIEGANTLDSLPSPSGNQETESSLTVETNQKDMSNPSTGNDDSDHKVRHSNYYGGKSNSRKPDEKRRSGNDSKQRKERYETESDYYSSDRDRKFREGSVRNDRGERDKKSKDRDHRDKREGSVRDQDRYREDKDERDGRRYDRDRPKGKHDRDREKDRDRERGGRYNNSKYETDSKYETESSVRHDRRRGDKDRDRYDYDYKRDDKDKRHRRSGGDRHDRDERDRRRDTDRDYRDRRRGDARGDRGRGGGSSNEFDDDTYSRRTVSSRNTRDNERDYKDRSMKDPRYGSNVYGYSSGYGYDAYSYYQHQQYFEQLRRTNPQAYAEWYRKYYGQVQTDMLANDGRESVHSGRSSANNDKDRSDQFNASLNLMDGASTTQEPQRLTPCKFTNEHSIATLANGLMVCVKPKYSPNGIKNIVKVWKFAPNDTTKRLFNSFPGPLVRGITHKKTIIEFCEDQIRLGPPSILLRSRNNSASSICSMGQANRASFTLMWTLLILLLRQNGMVVGTDIAELLLKNKNQFPYETNASNTNALRSTSGSRRNSIQSDQKKSQDNRSSPSDDENVNSLEDKEDVSVESDSKKSVTENEVTEKFRNYLLYGNVNEALEWATDNNLWGHALFLASKVDRRLHANVMMKFANKLSLNDPLQTLYQLMSGRTPSSVTSVQDEKWGDWRPHLAMILSNTSPRPDLDRKAITTLGDSLYNRGDLFGAQFCYLMAQVGFGRYSSVNQESSLMSNSVNAVRLVLLGASHHKTFKEFATNEAIIMTEIYEYACALNDDKFSIVEFQPYKYLLALRMLDYGMQLKTLMYMEQISRHIQMDPSKYETSFIQKVYALSDRLKFVDPMLEKSIDDQQNDVNQHEEQPWLQSLRMILNESHIYATQTVADIPTQAHIDQQFAEINQKFSALSMQYENYEPHIDQQPQQQQQLQHQQSYPGTHPPAQNDSYQMQYQRQPSNNGLDSGPQSADQYAGQYYNPNQQQMPSLPAQGNTTSDYDSYGPQSYEQQHHYGQEQHQHMHQSQGQQQEQDYGYWDQQNQQHETPRPQISMPNTISNKSGFYDDTTNDKSMTTSTSGKPGETTNSAADKKSMARMDNKKPSGGSNSTNSGWFGGIWNKLSLKPKNQMILPDDKNPAIVWDPDKKRWTNTDGNEEESESFKPPPKMADIVQNAYNTNISRQPNGGSDIAPPSKQMQPQIHQPSHPANYGQPDVPMMSTTSNLPQSSTSPGLISSATTNSMSASGNASTISGTVGEQMKTPSLQSNMFKMQRNRTLKKSYVDVFNPSGAPTKPIEPVLAPMLPPSAVPQGGIFVPAPVSSDDSGAQQHSQEGMPQFYNPNQFSGYQQQ